VSAIAIVTCRVLPEPDPDQELLVSACASAGLAVELASWDDPDVDWGRFRFAVLRSCWNYYEDPAAFRGWLDRSSSATKLWNALEVIRWNVDKRYLLRLEQEGVPIVPTRLVEKAGDLCEILRQTGWDRFVVKPTVSASSFMTGRFRLDQLDEAERLVSEILESRLALVQPYMARVESGGEVSLIHIDGELTHCVAKQPRFPGEDESVSQAFQPDAALANAAQLVMNRVTEPCLYARVDLMEDESGRWLLSELELIEPSLFLLQHPPALERMVRALGSI